MTVVEPGRGADYRLGARYAFITACLLALQEPFSALAARQLRSLDFLAVTQVALLLSIPPLLSRPRARRDFAAILKTPAYWPKLIALLAVGIAGLMLYDVALSSAHPIITAAILNLSPFWAALVARVVSKKSMPKPKLVFVVCFAVAFAGAMVVAFSQIDSDAPSLQRELIQSLFHSRWALALPMPIFFALSGSLVYHWFRAYDEGAAISANFLISAAVLIPVSALVSHGLFLPRLSANEAPAVVLLLIGTLASSAAGRLFYQASLSATEDDNGFVTMFFLAIPAISAAVSWPLSLWIGRLHTNPSVLFFEGLALVTAPLLVFSLTTGSGRKRGNGRTP